MRIVSRASGLVAAVVALAAAPAFSAMLYQSDTRFILAVNGGVNEVTGDCFNTEFIHATPGEYADWDSTLTGSLSSATQRSELRPSAVTATGSSTIDPCLLGAASFETSALNISFELFEPSAYVLSGIKTLPGVLLSAVGGDPLLSPDPGPFSFEGELQPGRYRLAISSSSHVGDEWSLNFELVPEASTLALAAAGLCGIAVWRRR